MKKIFIAVCGFFLLTPLTSIAQTEVDLDPEFGGRLSVSLDKKVARGFHISLEEEVRVDNNFGSFDRLHTTLAASYKVNSFLKLGLGYALITPYSSSNSAFKNPRHRLMVDATGAVHVGLWRLSLKERFQATRRTGDFNEYQNPATALTLKSRLKAQYKGFQSIEPYLFLEMRHYLNAPAISATYSTTSDAWLTDDGSTSGDAGWFLSGFNSSYVNRLRGCVGMEWRVTRQSSFDFYLMADWINDKVVDSNAEGTKLKSYTQEQGFVGWLGVSYRFAF